MTRATSGDLDGPTVPRRTSRRLGRFDHAERLTVGAWAAVMRGERPSATGWHAQPGWKIVVPRDGDIELRTEERTTRSAEALVVAPGVRHRLATTGPYLAVLFEPGALGGPPAGAATTWIGRTRLGAVRSLPDAPGDEFDQVAGELAQQLAAALGIRSSPVDPRLVDALGYVDQGPTVSAVARQVGLSEPHLRRLAARHLGVPLVRVRSWARLRRAVLLHVPLSQAAADAGFADQSHLARTARQLAGRSPGDITASIHAATTSQAGANPSSPGTASQPIEC